MRRSRLVRSRSAGAGCRVLAPVATGTLEPPLATLAWDPLSSAPPSLHGAVHVERLDNGLTVCVVENHRAPLVSCALWFRVGCRDEVDQQVGIAHFLEHMMFKGSDAYPAGEIDRLTQALGGVNNAFTSHDATAYHFDFAADRYATALDIEADRMRGLRLDPVEVTSERQVVVEEIAMYEDDPWDALELQAHAAFYAGHPYARSVLGSAETLANVGPDELCAFHRRYYGPDNAVLVLAGDVGASVVDEVAARFGAIEPRGDNPPRPRGEVPLPPTPAVPRRLERRFGDLARCLVMLPGPPSESADHSGLRLLMAALGVGRASRLQRALVDEGRLCSFIVADLTDSPDRAAISFAFEMLPGVDPARAEAVLWRELAALATDALVDEEAARLRRVLLADWIFGHESVHQQALQAGAGLTLFDLHHAERQLQATLAAPPADLPALAARYLAPERGALIAWSLPS